MTTRVRRTRTTTAPQCTCKICNEKIPEADFLKHLGNIHRGCGASNIKDTLVQDGTSVNLFKASKPMQCGDDYLYKKSVVGQYFCASCLCDKSQKRKPEREGKEEKLEVKKQKKKK